jgi:heptosyltransferase-2
MPEELGRVGREGRVGWVGRVGRVGHVGRVGKLAVLAPNWLGDAVMALPLIRDLRRGFEGASLVVVARPSVAPLFSMVPGVDRIVTLDGKHDVQRLIDESCDAALLLPNSFASAWLVKRAGIAERWGFSRDLRGPLLTKAFRTPLRYRHQVEYYQALGRALGLESGPPYAAIDVPDEAREAARILLNESGFPADRPFVVFAPGAAYGRAKQWLPERFAELARLLADDEIATVLVGARGDMPACEQIARESPAIDLCGRTDLATLAGVLSRARATVANDSGAMHLAAAVGIAVTAIFGPTNDQRTAPLQATGDAPAPVVVTTDVSCRPCMLRECPIDHRCMTRISASRVRNLLSF